VPFSWRMIIRNLVITVLVVELERIKDERTKDEQANKQPNKVKDAKKRKMTHKFKTQLHIHLQKMVVYKRHILSYE
jgi:hypothetical protein